MIQGILGGRSETADTGRKECYRDILGGELDREILGGRLRD